MLRSELDHEIHKCPPGPPVVAHALFRCAASLGVRGRGERRRRDAALERLRLLLAHDLERHLAADLLDMLLQVAHAGLPAVALDERGQRRITVNYAKKQQGRRVFQAQSSHLPLKINMAGVIPAIFASSLLLAPASMASWFGSNPGMGALQQIALVLSPGQPLYIMMFAAGIIFFSFFYTAIMFDPKDVADNLKRQGAYVPGIRPGAQTSKYIDDVITRLTVFGSLYVTLVCLLPEFMVVFFDTSFQLGGTAVLIVVVVAMDFMAQVQSHLMSSQYAKLMEKSKIQNYGKRR